MNIKYVDIPNGDLLIRLGGEMDAIGCTQARDELEQLGDYSDKHILLDLSRVTFLDSSGVGAIVFLFKRLKEKNGTLEIVGAQGQPQELLHLLRINSAIPVQTGAYSRFQNGSAAEHQQCTP